MKNFFKIFDKIKIGPGMVIFILFFGVSVLESFRTRNWMNVAIWMVIAIIFLVADASKKDAHE